MNNVFRIGIIAVVVTLANLLVSHLMHESSQTMWTWAICSFVAVVVVESVFLAVQKPQV